MFGELAVDHTITEDLPPKHLFVTLHML